MPGAPHESNFLTYHAAPADSVLESAEDVIFAKPVLHSPPQQPMASANFGGDTMHRSLLRDS